MALADLSTIARRTALTGTSNLIDALVVCPGIHKQQDAPDLVGGEYPACAAMTSGYVFRVENPATVLFLQKVGETGHLTTLSVKPQNQPKAGFPVLRRLLSGKVPAGRTSWLANTAYAMAVAVTLVAIVIIILLQDWWALRVIGILTMSRFINVIVIRRRVLRATQGWKGASEPGVKGDLLILMSQDRWIRLQGDVDDLKAVTSGQWLQEPTFIESAFVALATLLVYIDAALAGNARQEGKLLLIILLCVSVGLLGMANEWTDKLHMHGRTLQVVKKPQKYARRLALAEQLVEESGRRDWAVRMGMIPTEPAPNVAEKMDGQVIM